jgi:hypothetical protein
MKKYKIELSEEQLRLVAFCLEDVSRFASGDCELRFTMGEVLRDLPFEEKMERRTEARELLGKLKKVLFPNLEDNANYGYNGSEFIGNTYQIYRTIMHRLSVDNDLQNVYSSSALPSGNMGTVNVEQLPEEKL